MSHTPGPWIFSHDADGSWSEHDDPLGVRYIRAAGKMGALLGGVKYYPWTPDNVDDWTLIAAAPDLLAALKAQSRDDGECFCEVGIGNPNMRGEHSPACKQALDAIRKAEGR